MAWAPHGGIRMSSSFTRAGRKRSGAGALAALLLYGFGQWSARQGVENGAIITMARDALAAGKAHRVRQFQLSALARANADSAVLWHRRAMARTPVLARLDSALSVAHTTADSNGVLVQENTELRAQVGDLTVAYARLDLARRADSTRADQADRRVALLETQLASVLTVADCHMLGLGFLPKCPSRTVSAVLGAGAAVGVVLIVR